MRRVSTAFYIISAAFGVGTCFALQPDETCGDSPRKIYSENPCDWRSSKKPFYSGLQNLWRKYYIMDPNKLPEGILVGIGNPLLDISACVGEDLLHKYGMEPDGAIMAEKKHMPLYKELMDNYKVDFLAGGSVQNSLRVAQWLLKKPRVMTYFGCVGDDDYACILRDRATADGVYVQYQVSDKHPTGTCAVLVTGLHRSLCANLAAAQHFTPEHLAEEESVKSIERAKFFYASGFFVAVSPESIRRLAEAALARGHVFIMNLSAPFVSQFYKEPLEMLLPYTDVVFGNEAEAEALAKAFNIEHKDLKDIGLKVSEMPKKNTTRKRVVVITHGANPVTIVEGTNVEYVEVPPLAREEMVDTNGAGDAFVGGFLSQLVLGKPYTTCCRAGIYAARHIIQHMGCTFTGESNFTG